MNFFWEVRGSLSSFFLCDGTKVDRRANVLKFCAPLLLMNNNLAPARCFSPLFFVTSEFYSLLLKFLLWGPVNDSRQKYYSSRLPVGVLRRGTTTFTKNLAPTSTKR